MSISQKIFPGFQKEIQNYLGKNKDYSFNNKNPIVKLHEYSYASEEIIAALDVLLSTNVTMGEKVRDFEDSISQKFSLENSITNNSGSSANLLAISALCNIKTENHLKPGDEIIVPALAWSTSIWPLLQFGLVPVFCDIDLTTFNIDTTKIKKLITSKTRAIMTIPIYGNPCSVDEVLKICNDYNLQLIEDNCESMGARYRDKHIGGHGRVSTFSFYFSHHITTLEGGVCCTNDEELSDTLRILRSHGWIRESKKKQAYMSLNKEIDPKFLFVNLGYNLRLTELQAAMGLIQLDKLDDFVLKRRANAEKLRSGLECVNNIISFQIEEKDSDHSWFGFPIVINKIYLKKVSVKSIREHLLHCGIETRPIVAGNISKQPVMKDYKFSAGDLENADYLMENSFSLPCHQSLDEGAIKHMIDSLVHYLSKI